MDTKKPYTPPTITEHGNAVKETKGWCGIAWEHGSPRIGVSVDWE